jgi:UDP-glucose 4-epimerase
MIDFFNKKIAVTGGTGFIGSSLVRKLLEKGYQVKVLDNFVRGEKRRLSDLPSIVEIVQIDIRDEEALAVEIAGFDAVFHLAAVNGTENFYNNPELVLDVGVRGAISVVNACRKANVEQLVVASSAEVYQEPDIFPTPEDIPLQLPNSINPRYSYGGSKIMTELIAMNYGRDFFKKMQIFRPHNVYGPDMGWKHVIPQFILRGHELVQNSCPQNGTPFQIIGNGQETRAFSYIDDVVEGIILMFEKGLHREIYNIGSDDEVTIKELLQIISGYFKTNFTLVESESAEGAASRRCPDLTKIKRLGYQHNTSLEDGVQKAADWYISRSDLAPLNSLM